MDVLGQAELGGSPAKHMQGGTEVTAESAQRHAVQFVDLLQHIQVAVGRRYVQIMGHAAELQVQVQ
ncbi:hypothetical protein D3C84_1276700 [compost metagenome]